MTRPDFALWVKRARAQTELWLERSLPDRTATPTQLHEAMRYAVLGGGKRIRAMLVMAAAHLGDADERAVAQAAAAVELIHAYSLVHDDLPSMDNDVLRRGKPTCHIAYGEANALLAGDALQASAFEILMQDNTLPAAQRITACRTLAQTVGSCGMVGGQFIDLNQVGQTLTQAELETMHRLKTGALIAASVTLGYNCCHNTSPDVQAALNRYAPALGLAFQVVDDVLDHEADSSTLGKTAGKDAQNHKPTFVSLLGADAAKTYAQDLQHTALNAIAMLDERADLLRGLAELIVVREY
ncbi:MAG: polyprenyl synthetase family protein [Neisseria sp.]|nr:polyprenyl synthetase family protein [Neisseria sp.]